MKLFHVLVVGAAFLFASTTVMADSVDPQITPRTAGGGVGLPTGFQQVDMEGGSQPTFQFMANASGGGLINLTNETDTTIFNLAFVATVPIGPNGTVTVACNQDSNPIFANCQSIVELGTEHDGMVTIKVLFTNGQIAPGESFEVDLNNGINNLNPNGAGGWGANAQIRGLANVPEPGTMALLMTGLVGLAWAAWRKKIGAGTST